MWIQNCTCRKCVVYWRPKILLRLKTVASCSNIDQRVRNYDLLETDSQVDVMTNAIYRLSRLQCATLCGQLALKSCAGFQYSSAIRICRLLDAPAILTGHRTPNPGWNIYSAIDITEPCCWSYCRPPHLWPINIDMVSRTLTKGRLSLDRDVLELGCVSQSCHLDLQYFNPGTIMSAFDTIAIGKYLK